MLLPLCIPPEDPGTVDTLKSRVFRHNMGNCLEHLTAGLETFGLLGLSTICCAVGPNGLVLRPEIFLAVSNPYSQSASVIIVGFTGCRLYTYLAQSSMSRGGIFVSRVHPTWSFFFLDRFVMQPTAGNDAWPCSHLSCKQSYLNNRHLYAPSPSI